MGININNSIQGNVNRMVQMNEQAASAAHMTLVSQEDNPLFTSEILTETISYCDLQTIGRLACVSKYFHVCVGAYEKTLNLERFCPKLTILDAKAQGIIVDDEPRINRLQVLKWYKELAPHVENEEGLTLLTMPKGLTLWQLVGIEKQTGVPMNGYATYIERFREQEHFEEQADAPLEQTYVILITNSVVRESQNMTHSQHQELVAGHGCVMPAAREYVALCVFTNKYFQKCLYGNVTGRASTLRAGCPMLVIYNTDPHYSYRLSIDDRAGGFAHKLIGAGGRKKF